MKSNTPISDAAKFPVMKTWGYHGDAVDYAVCRAIELDCNALHSALGALLNEYQRQCGLGVIAPGMPEEVAAIEALQSFAAKRK